MKRSDVHHVTFHIERATVLLSVPEATTLASLRSQLVPALATLARSALSSSPPSSADDIQLWEDRDTEGATGIRVCDEGSIKSLGWARWKRLYISIRGDDGSFGEPSYTIPDPMDGDEEQ
ncbi:hypothetical protein CC85DRAFT_288413 [Cutaneotrichosporon oleaginosum]|uniref:Uncharacterized protein n=1 Tax=Cutaneotrichosporon oleaginosum TaxID=879819 RepID=A0A0J0XER0_9TREE|nr:uncharacterized protein CC85DRAFT_288413 [Cutaneotrichosporon oleaginosum]KLT39555.1 hypothetical protein CC85DRAFT_288413 [Cutaneotrichosporon oleaginosum]